MSNQLDVNALRRALASVPGLEFALLFGSMAREGGRSGADIDVAVYLDHEPTLEERATMIGLVQDTVRSDQVDLVCLNITDNGILQREVLYGKLLVCHNPEGYASYFSLADRRGRDERDRISRAWAMRHELRLQADIAEGASQ